MEFSGNWLRLITLCENITHFWSCGPDWQGPDTVCSELTKVLGYVSKIMPMVLGKLPGLGRPTIWMTVGQGRTALAVGAGGGCLDIFSLVYHFYFLSFFLSLGDGPM